MQKYVAGLVTVGVAVSLAAGCASSPRTTSDKDVFGVLQEKASKITASGGLAAVGIGESRTIALAIDKAKVRARTEMAHIISTKVDSLRKQFAEEIGEGKGSEVNAMFSSADKHLASQELAGTAPTDIKYQTKDGITTAYALVEQNPKILASAMENIGQQNKNMYTRFRASQAFKELDDEVKKYDEFKKNQGN